MFNNTSMSRMPMNFTHCVDFISVLPAPQRADIGGLSGFMSVIVIPFICACGILGNLLILFTLGRKKMQHNYDNTDRPVQVGLCALALSDMMFCLITLPLGFVNIRAFACSITFKMVYRCYSVPLMNIFILSSTWFTVFMATSRYLAICHPFRARYLICMKGTKISIAVIFITCVSANIPRFFHYKIKVIPLSNSTLYSYEATTLDSSTLYMWVYFIIGLILPLIMLGFCNIRLVKALRESIKIRQQLRVRAAHVESNYRITTILVVIVIMYILLVPPNEILGFIRKLSPDKTAIHMFAVATLITNILQIINFAFNFVLYALLNVHFRQTLRDIICVCGCKKSRAASGRPQVSLPRRGMSTRTLMLPNTSQTDV